jgi:Phosphotransferase enzyme family
MDTPTQLGYDLFRILLYRRDAAEILLETTKEGFRLPFLSVPRHRREAEEITAAIRTSWNLETYALFPLPASSPHPFVHDYVVESSEADTDGPLGMEWLSIGALSVEVFHTPSDFAALQNCLRILEQYRRNELPGPFGKPGWLHTITEWVDRRAAVARFHLTGPVRQSNASPTFSLLRFETDGPALWFKAVGEPNLHEYPITLELTRTFPSFVPRVIATCEDWHAWLGVEAEGKHPDEKSDLDTWKRIATTLGELQIASFGQTQHLLNAGCRDVRACTLLELVEPFLAAMADLMERQTKGSPPPLSRTELRTLQAQLEEVLSAAAKSEIPTTLGHLDFNSGNIVVNSEGCTFLDWAEACAGTPMITFQYLLEHFRRQRQHACESCIISAYLNAWRPLFSPKNIATALRVSPLLAVFAYAACGDTWRDPAHRNCPEVARHFRSLTRRVKREADRLLGRKTTPGAPCRG